MTSDVWSKSCLLLLAFHSRSKLPLKATFKLRKFFIAHIDNPFPTDDEKKQLANETELLFKQVSDCQ